ncbi:hypothetical protein LCGC14_1979720, partial [marine sediment metagenome]
SGKSTLAHVLMGNPKYKITGKIILDEKDITKLSSDERAKKVAAYLLQIKKIKINSEKKVGNKVFIRCNFDWILVCENDEVKEIFNVYDLEDYKYDKDIDCIIVTGHETLHRYIISSGKYKVTHTR